MRKSIDSLSVIVVEGEYDERKCSLEDVAKVVCSVKVVKNTLFQFGICVKSKAGLRPHRIPHTCPEV